MSLQVILSRLEVGNRGGMNHAGNAMQVTYEDCLDMLDLDEDEVAAIAHHEHIPMANAVLMADYMLHEPDGVPKLKRMIVDDLEEARAADNVRRVAELEAVLRHFVRTHPSSPGVR